MGITTYRDLGLANQIATLEKELKKIKTQQTYGTSQIKTSTTFHIDVNAYSVWVPPEISGFQGGNNVGEVAAKFLFRGADPTKTALGIWTITSNKSNSWVNQQFVRPTSQPNELELWVVVRFNSDDLGTISVDFTSNMAGSFSLEQTYTVYIS